MPRVPPPVLLAKPGFEGQQPLEEMCNATPALSRTQETGATCLYICQENGRACTGRKGEDPMEHRHAESNQEHESHRDQLLSPRWDDSIDDSTLSNVPLKQFQGWGATPTPLDITVIPRVPRGVVLQTSVMARGGPCPHLP